MSYLYTSAQPLSTALFEALSDFLRMVDECVYFWSLLDHRPPGGFWCPTFDNQKTFVRLNLDLICCDIEFCAVYWFSDNSTFLLLHWSVFLTQLLLPNPLVFSVNCAPELNCDSGIRFSMSWTSSLDLDSWGKIWMVWEWIYYKCCSWSEGSPQNLCGPSVGKNLRDQSLDRCLMITVQQKFNYSYKNMLENQLGKSAFCQ